jgi:hypothetical protein
MRRVQLAAIAFCLQAWAAEPIAGLWRLDSQETNGEKSNAEAMILKVTQSGDKFQFAFSMPVNKIYFVGTSYAVRTDGSEGDVLNSHGDKIGTVQMTVAAPSRYRLVVKGANRPVSNALITVSPDGKTLTSESDAVQAGHAIHSKQIFSRHE